MAGVAIGICMGIGGMVGVVSGTVVGLISPNYYCSLAIGGVSSLITASYYFYHRNKNLIGTEIEQINMLVVLSFGVMFSLTVSGGSLGRQIIWSLILD